MRKTKKTLSILLTAAMLLSMLSAGFTAAAADTQGTTGINIGGREFDTSSLDEIKIYWTRSKEWMEGELTGPYGDVDENETVLTLRAGETYELSKLLAAVDDPADTTNNYTYDVQYNPSNQSIPVKSNSYKYSSMKIAYADKALSNKETLALEAGSAAADAIWQLYNAEPKFDNVKYDIKYVWDGGFRPAGSDVLTKLTFTDTTVTPNVVYEYDYQKSQYPTVTDMSFRGTYASGTEYSTGDVVKGSDHGFYRYVGTGKTTQPPVIGSPEGAGAQDYNNWEHLTVKVQTSTGETEESYDVRYGIYHYKDQDRFKRWGNKNNQGEWCTWLTHTEADYYNLRAATTVRRFSGYFYLTEEDFQNKDLIYLALADGASLVAGDDAMDVFVNGKPLYRATTNDLSEGANSDYTIKGTDNSVVSSEANLLMRKNGYDYNNTPYGAPCNEPTGSENCVVSPIKYNGGTSWTPSDPAEAEKLYNQNYAFAAYWHVHTSESTFDISDLLQPGANRIDIIAGDYDDGGGMSRLHLFTSGKTIKSGAIDVAVNAYVNDNPDSNTKFDTQVSPVFEKGTSAVVKEAVSQPVNTPIYYEYIVSNPDSNDLYGVEVVDNRLNIKITPNGVYEREDPNDSSSPWKTTPVDPGSYTVQTVDETGASVPATLSELLSKINGKTDDGTVTSKTIRIDFATTTFPDVGKFQTPVTASGHDESGTQTFQASNTTYVIMHASIKNDWVVVDYGLPVTLDVLSNDNYPDGSNPFLKALAWDSQNVSANLANANNGQGTRPSALTFQEVAASAGDTPNQTPVRGNYGELCASSSDKNAVTYTPTKFINDVDVFVYESQHTLADVGEPYNRYASVTVVPASSVYYEDNFSSSTVGESTDSAIIYGGNWSVVTDDGTGNAKPTTDGSQSNNNSSAGTNTDNYGYDNQYKDDLGFSFGSAHQIGGAEKEMPSWADYQKDPANEGKTYRDYLTEKIAPIKEDFVNGAATVTFNFRGTGFDIISYTDNRSGVIKCQVTKQGTDTVVKDILVSNYYEVPNKALYQIPVISVKNLEWGDYTVQLTVDGTRTYPSTGNVVVIDGIRIYNPLSANAQAKEDYYTEAEKHAVIYELRDLLRNQNSNHNTDIGGNRIKLFGVENYYVGSNDEGAPPVYDDDGNEIEHAIGGVQLDRYNMDGPKNELYVTSVGTGVTFKYSPSSQAIADSIPLTMQIEAKSLNNAATNMTVRCRFSEKGENETATANGSGNGWYKEKTISVGSGKQMYYNVSDLLPEIPQSSVFEIYKSGEELDSEVGLSKGTILSLSTIKVTEGSSLGRDTASFDPVQAIATGITFDRTAMQIKTDGTGRVGVLINFSDGKTKTPKEAGINISVKEKDGNNLLAECAYDQETGMISLKGGSVEGTTTIVATSETEGFPRTAEIQITVSDNGEQINKITGIRFLNRENNETISMFNNGKGKNFIPVLVMQNGEYVLPSTLGVTVHTAVSGTQDIISTSAIGAGGILTVTPLAIGEGAVLTASYGDFSASLNFNVIATPPLFPISMNLSAPTGTELKVGGTVVIQANQSTVLYGADGYDETETRTLAEAKDDLTFSCAKAGLSAAIDADGNIQVTLSEDFDPGNGGEIDIDIKYGDQVLGTLKTRITYVAAKGVDVSASGTRHIPVGGSVALTGTVTPSDATNQRVYWSGGAAGVAEFTVDAENPNKILVTAGNSLSVTDDTRQIVEFTAAAGSQSSTVNKAIKVYVYDTAKAQIYDSSKENYNSKDLVIYEDGYYYCKEWTRAKPTDSLDTSEEGNGSGAWIYIGPVAAGVTGVTITPPQSNTIFVGDKVALQATVTATGGASTEVLWSSSDDSIAKVDENGVVTALKTGEVTITATSGFDSTKSASITFTVAAEVPVTGITITGSSKVPVNVAGSVDGTTVLNAEVTPAEATNKKVTWSSNNTAIATVDETGKVTGISVGTAVITATSVANPDVSATFTIEVINFSGTVSVKPAVAGEWTKGAWVEKGDGASLSNISDSMVKDLTPGTHYFVFGIENDYYKSYQGYAKFAEITVSNTGAISVRDVRCTSTSWDAAPVMEAAGTTYAKIVQQADGSYILQWTEGVTPDVPVDSVTLDTNSLSFTGKGTQQLTATVLPEDAGNKAVVWSSDNQNVVTVDQNGLVTAVGVGTANITVKSAADGTKIATATVTVTDAEITAIGLTNQSLYIDETVTLIPNYMPDNLFNPSVTWSSNNNDVATVDQNGKVTAVSAGTATITAEAANGVKGTATITVEARQVTGVTVDISETAFVKNSDGFTPNNVTVNATVQPANATNKQVTWESNDINVATVENGVITPVGTGNAVITVRTVDGGYTAQVQVTVTEAGANIPVTDVTMRKDGAAVSGTVNLQVNGTMQLEAVVTPGNATNKAVTWSSSQQEVASVSDNGLVTALAEGDTVITVTTADGGKTAQLTVHVEAGSSSGLPVTITPAQNTNDISPYTLGAWFEANGATPTAAVHASNQKVITEAGVYYYGYCTTGFGYGVNGPAVQITVSADGQVTYSAGTFECAYEASTATTYMKFTAGNANYDFVYDNANSTITLVNKAQAANAVLNSKSKAMLLGNGSAVLGVPDAGSKITNINNAAAYDLIRSSGVLPTVVASSGYSLTEKDGYTLLEDAVKSLVLENDQSDLVVISINDSMTEGDRTIDLIAAMESLLNTVHSLSPNAKILLVASRGAYTRYMQDAVEAAGLSEIVSFMEDTSSAVSGSQAVTEQEELRSKISEKVAQILSSGTDENVWTVLTAYNVGDIVSYNGINYECITAHAARDNNTAPDCMPDYWKPVLAE